MLGLAEGTMVLGISVGSCVGGVVTGAEVGRLLGLRFVGGEVGVLLDDRVGRSELGRCVGVGKPDGRLVGEALGFKGAKDTLGIAVGDFVGS
jgi:hypothetical protein